MRPKNKFLIIVILLFLYVYELKAQQVPYYQYYDSVTYSFYLSGKWNELITLGHEALNKGIDYKYLRQRVGYARFISGDYYKSRKDFEKALTFDSYDQFTLEYLYYSYLNTGKEEYAGLIEKKLGSELKKSLGIAAFKPIESIELEYNFKYAGTSYRSNPQYYRLGVGTKLGNRLSLIQTFSGYRQAIEIQLTGLNETYSNSQTEYFSQMKMIVSSRVIAKAGYHFLNTRSGTSVFRGNMFSFAVASDLNRFSLELSGSVLDIEYEKTYQTGFQAGYVFPGRSDFYLLSTVSGLFQNQSNNLILSQKAGLHLLKRVWIEGNSTFGRMANYNDYNGLYIYNSIDPMIFRSGVTMYIPVNRKITFWANCSLEKKEFYENSSFIYNQFSYLGGIKWKL